MATQAGWGRARRCALAPARLLFAALTALVVGVAAAQSPAAAPAPAPASVAPAAKLRAGILASYPPFQIWPQGGPPGGADLELLRGFADRAGLALEAVRYADYAPLEADLRAGRIDVSGAMARTPAREGVLHFTPPYAQVQLALVTRAEMPSGALIPDLAGRSLAVVSGFASELQAERLFPLASRVVVKGVPEALSAVQSARADAFVEALPVVAELIARDGVGGVVVARRFDAPSGRLHFALAPARAALADALARDLAALAPAQVQATIANWSAALPPVRNGPLVLSDAERERLARWPAPVVGIVGNDPPFAARGPGGRPLGLSVELLQGVLARLGVKVGGWRFLGAAEVDVALAAAEVDLLLGLEEAATSGPGLRFAGPFIEYPTVLVGRADGGAFDLEQLQGRRLALTAGSAARPLVESRHPGVRVVECRDAEHCLEIVAREDADATLLDVVSAAVLLAGTPRAQLQMIGAEPRLRRTHSVAIAERHAELAPLLKRALDDTVAAELPALKTRWFGRKLREDAVRAELRRSGPWLLAALALLAGLWVWHSRRLRAEVQRTRAARAQAERAEQASRRFTAFLAHEVRNSLHSVIAGTELLRGRTPGAIVLGLHGAAMATLRLLNNLLDRDRLDAGRLVLRTEPARLAAVVAAVVAEMAPAAQQKGLELRGQATGPDPELMLDTLRVQQVLRNLLSNAIKYSRRGRVDVTASATASAGGRWLIVLEVRDQGPGFDAAADGSVPVADAAAGSGLGLPLCRDLARLMGGALRLRSTPGVGTTATLEFEADGGPAAAGAAAGRHEARALDVLLVEDTEAYALLLEQALAQRGHRVRTAADLGQAQRRIDERRPELLLLDWHLGDGQAQGLLTWLADQGHAGQWATVVMTADVDDRLSGRPGLGAASAVLAKSADPRQMAARVLEAAQRAVAPAA